DSDHDFIYGVAQATTDVRPGVVSMAHARGGEPALDGRVRTIGSSTARLVTVERDFEPISGIPRQSAIPVNVRALDPAELAAIAADEPAVADQQRPSPRLVGVEAPVVSSRPDDVGSRYVAPATSGRREIGDVTGPTHARPGTAPGGVGDRRARHLRAGRLPGGD